jgi:hypothetical protein
VLLDGVQCGEFAAAQVHAEEAREMIYGGAGSGRADMAHVASRVKGAGQHGTRSVRIQGEDPLKVYRSLVGITHVKRVPEGR